MARRQWWQQLAPRWRRGWVWAALTLGLVLNGLRLRQRLSGLDRLDPNAAGSTDAGDFLLLCSPGVEVSGATQSAAARYADDEELDVLDLVPADLAPERALDLARGVDPTTYRSAALAPGRGAGHAILVRRDVAKRAEAAAPGDRASSVRLTERLKHHAPRSTDLVVADGVHAVEVGPSERFGELKAVYNAATPLALAIPAARSALLLGGLLLSPGWGVAALAAFLAQPYLATAGTALTPAGLTPGTAAQRILEPFTLGRLALAGPGAGEEDPIEARRAGYAHALAGGTQRFFEPRRATCPWCGGAALVERLRTTDLIQYKPGEFVLDECRDCELVFQNPRLSLEGLDFYYRDFYDGLGAGGTEFLFAQSMPAYLGRVRLAARHGTPRAWLDVGTGYGHFCVVARGLLPETRFDGLDMGSSVEDGERRGWVDHAYRGMFPDLAGQLAGRYDVVSMHHYLEHVRDPRAELRAAHEVLEPGGRLLVEVPDPESNLARLFGRYWVPWFQPQHQHFLTVAHLTGALESLGFSVVEVERGEAHQPMDLAGAAWGRGSSLAPPARVPWRAPPTAGDRVKRVAILAATAPIALVALVVDQALRPVIKKRGAGWSNAYRVLARRL